MTPIYLDYNATTPIAKEVAEAMQPFLGELFGNPSSSHEYGIEAKKAVIKARSQVAALINCRPDEIVFTSGGTESNNFAIKGVAFANKNKGNHILTTSIEHPAVIEVCKFLQENGFEVTYLPVDEFGMVNPDDVAGAIRHQTILISVMHANNEVGTIQPIRQIADIARKKGILFHTDAAQTLGKIPADVNELGVDLLSIAGHKIYAPKGIGALYIRQGVKIQKLIHGADHEMNRRAGTENVLEIIGLGMACEIAGRDLEKNSHHFREMRDLLEKEIATVFPQSRINGHPEKKLPNTLSISFPGVEANTLLSELAEVAASAGAACHTDNIDISPVLQAMQVPTEFAMGTIRFSTGRHTTRQEITSATEYIIPAVNRLIRKKEIKTGPAIKPAEIKLTHFTHGMGCACKIRPQYLERVLKDFPVPNDPNVLISLESADDAAVYRINETTALIQTVDFFTPIVDDPYSFGAIAAANALSDIYAMGGRPLFALNIVGFPDSRLPMEVLRSILKGASDKAKEAGISILGGHTVEDTEPKFGMTVSGIIDPKKILTNSNAQPGDDLILTKPIGTGIISTGIKRGLVSPEKESEVIRIMSALNRQAAEVMSEFPVNACTDITGFGLAGHLKEMTEGSKVDAEIIFDTLPWIEPAPELAANNVIPGGTVNNMDFVKEVVIWDEDLSFSDKALFCDAQTSGGLLISVPHQFSESLKKALIDNGVQNAAIIGKIVSKGVGKIILKKQD